MVKIYPQMKVYQTQWNFRKIIYSTVPCKVRIVPAAHFRQRKTSCFRRRLGVRFTWFHGQGNLSSLRKNMPVAWFSKKKPRSFDRGLVFALPIFTASHPATIVGVHVLNFCVRDGNRWTHMTINTNSLGWILTIFYNQNSLELRSLVTHTGFEPMLTA